jgi:hypothetical protein
MGFHVAGNMTAGELEASLDNFDKRLDSIESGVSELKTDLNSIVKSIEALATSVGNIVAFSQTGRLPNGQSRDDIYGTPV